MKVLYIGNFEPSHSTENEVRSSFEALGWEVDTLQENHLQGQPFTFWITELRERAFDSDLVLYTRTWGLPDERALEFWAWCKEQGIVTASFHLDRFYDLASPKGPLQRYAMPAVDPMFRTEYVFTPDGDHDNEWERDGVNHYWLPPAIGSSSCWSGTRSQERWPQKVAFVGSYGYHPEWAHRPLLIDQLRQRFGDDFIHISGDGDYPGPSKGALRGNELHDLYATIPVIVGDSCWVGATKPPETRYWSDRVYEVWGRGGFLLMPQIDALQDQLGLYPCWYPWDDFDAMEDAIRALLLLGRPTLRDIGEKTVMEVRQHHTYRERIIEMLDIMGIENE